MQNFSEFYFIEGEQKFEIPKDNKPWYDTKIRDDGAARQKRLFVWDIIKHIVTSNGEFQSTTLAGNPIIVSKKAHIGHIPSNIRIRLNDPKLSRATVASKIAQTLDKKGYMAKLDKKPKSQAPWIRIYAVVEGKVTEILRFEFKDSVERKVRASDYESGIVQIWNELNGVQNENPIKEEVAEASKAIVVKLKNLLDTEANAVHTGSNRLGEESLSDFWKTNNDRPDSTPKPDFKIEDRRISLKIGTAAQLCSSKIIGAEGNKLILSSLEGTNIGKQVEDKIRLMISLKKERDKKSFIGKFLVRNQKKDIGPENPNAKITSDSKDEEKHDISYYEAYHKELTELLNKGAMKDQQFKRNIVMEAMTGNKKFVLDDGKANYMLSAPYDGSFINFKKIKDINIDKVVEQANMYVSFKSSKNSMYSALRVGTSIDNDEIDLDNQSTKIQGKPIYEMFSLEYFEAKAEEYGINHRMLNEGIFDRVKKVWNILVDAIKRGIAIFLGLFGIEVDFEYSDRINFLEV